MASMTDKTLSPANASSLGESPLADSVLEETFNRYRARGRGWVGPEQRPRDHRAFGQNTQAQTSPGLGENRRATRVPLRGFDWALMARLESQDGLGRPDAGTQYGGVDNAGPSERDPRLLGSVLNSELKRRHWERPLQVGAVVSNWSGIVGELVANNCPVESFENGRLVVRATSSAWAQQLRLLLPEVMGRITEVVGAGVVETVVVQGPRAPSWKHGIRNSPGRGPRDTYG